MPQCDAASVFEFFENSPLCWDGSLAMWNKARRDLHRHRPPGSISALPTRIHIGMADPDLHRHGRPGSISASPTRIYIGIADPDLYRCHRRHAPAIVHRRADTPFFLDLTGDFERCCGMREDALQERVYIGAATCGIVP